MSLIRKEDLIAEYDRVHQDRNEIERLESVTSYKINRLCDAIIQYIESVSDYGVEEDWLVSELKGIKEYDR